MSFSHNLVSHLMPYFRLDISSDGCRDKVGLPAVLDHSVSLETNLGRLPRDAVSPSNPCRGQGRPPAC